MENREIITQTIFENNSSPLHSLEWNLTKEKHGQHFIYFSYKSDDSSAAFPIVIKNIGPLKIGWVPYGIPIKGHGKEILKNLKKKMRSNNIFILITIGYNFFNSQNLEQLFLQIPIVKHNLTTFVLDLKNLDEELLLNRFNSTTRKHVKRAIQDGYTVEPMSIEDYSKFYALYQKLCERQGFTPVCSEGFLKNLVETSHTVKNSNFRVVGLKAVKNGVHFGYLIGLINGRVLLEFLRADDTSIDTKGYERKLLTYNLICAALQDGVELYDFGGVVLTDKGEGIFNFKKSFGGELVHSTKYRFTLCF